MELEFTPSSEYDRMVVEITNEAYEDFKNNRNNELKYRNMYADRGPEIWDRVSLGAVYTQAYQHAREAAEEKNSNLGKILGKIDLSKFKR